MVSFLRPSATNPRTACGSRDLSPVNRHRNRTDRPQVSLAAPWLPKRPGLAPVMTIAPRRSYSPRELRVQLIKVRPTWQLNGLIAFRNTSIARKSCTAKAHKAIAKLHFSRRILSDRIGSANKSEEIAVEMTLTPEFWSALAAIVVVNLVLSGDNAIVIALAARKLPGNLQRRAIVWGTLGAVAVRVTLTAGVLWLLTLPGLSFTGGLLLAAIAYQLLTGDSEGGGDIAPASGFWGAMRTIVLADAAMGLDNVLGVAGAAGGNLTLVILGLAISIPIVVWGSTLILRSIQHFPALLYAGGVVLASTAA